MTIYDLTQAEPIWRKLEGTAVATPYQRFDWCNALIQSGVETGTVAIAALGPRASPHALLPLVIERKWGLTCGRLIGAKVGNTDALICDPKALPLFDAPTTKAQLRKIAEAVGGLDILSFFNLRSDRVGITNPLIALNPYPAPSRLYTATISSCPVPYIEHGVSAKLRTNLKRGTRRLAEMFGPVRLEAVSDEKIFASVHAAFLAQRSARFAQMGVTNVFAQPQMVRFFTLAAKLRTAEDVPPLIAHALYAGDEIVATSFGTRTRTHYSQYINSTSSGPANKYSLMGILVALMIDDLQSSGITTLDMGLGDFPYKTAWTEAELVFDAIMPFTARGEVAAHALRSARHIKRAIKQNATLWSIAQSVRRKFYRINAASDARGHASE